MSAQPWEPGDPLFFRAPYRDGLYGFRDDTATDECHCADAAHWPSDASSRALHPDGDELARFIREWHEWNETQR